MNKVIIAAGIAVGACAFSAVPTVAAATEPVEPVTVHEVALYVYKKIDPTLPAAWSNSGVQDLITYVDGSDWFTEFPGDLPAYVCGPGWGVQQDKVKHDGAFVWPESIEYPHDNIGWPPIYAAQHVDLEQLVTVPDCVPTPEPTRTIEPTPYPSLIPPIVAVPEEPTLAPTGLEGWFYGLLALAAVMTVAGWWLVRRSHDSSTTTTGEHHG